jgi:hypothetical protein
MAVDIVKTQPTLSFGVRSDGLGALVSRLIELIKSIGSVCFPKAQAPSDSNQFGTMYLQVSSHPVHETRRNS